MIGRVTAKFNLEQSRRPTLHKEQWVLVVVSCGSGYALTTGRVETLVPKWKLRHTYQGYVLSYQIGDFNW
jgi:hypothetical protein